jgi:hypothetical protein
MTVMKQEAEGATVIFDSFFRGALIQLGGIVHGLLVRHDHVLARPDKLGGVEPGLGIVTDLTLLVRGEKTTRLERRLLLLVGGGECGIITANQLVGDVLGDGVLSEQLRPGALLVHGGPDEIIDRTRAGAPEINGSAISLQHVRDGALESNKGGLDDRARAGALKSNIFLKIKTRGDGASKGGARST